MPSSWKKGKKLLYNSAHLESSRISGCASSSERIHASCEGEETDDGEAAPPRLPVVEEEFSAALAGIAASDADIAAADVDILQSVPALPLSDNQFSLLHS